MPPPNFTITPAITPADLSAIATLFNSYATALQIDLTFQSFAAELATLPGAYSPPRRGALLLARETGTGAAMGCVALRALGDANCNTALDCAEMKRLYVAPAGRGLGLGKALAEAVVREAKILGYEAVRLDTLPNMHAARAVYEQIGFSEIEGYYATPIEGTIFLELKLR